MTHKLLMSKAPAAGGAFSPDDLPDMELWLPVMSSPSSVTSAAGRVTQVDDSSGNGRNFTVSSTGPAWGARVINSANVMDFDGVTGLQNASGATMTVATFAFVVDIDTLDSVGQFFEGNFDNRMATGTSTLGSGVVQSNNGAGIWTDGSASAGAYDVGPIVLVSVFNGATSSIRINGVEVATGNTGSNSTNNQWGLGARYTGGGRNFDGGMGEVVVCSSVLSGADLSNLETYLADLAGT